MEKHIQKGIWVMVNLPDFDGGPMYIVRVAFSSRYLEIAVNLYPNYADEKADELLASGHGNILCVSYLEIVPLSLGSIYRGQRGLTNAWHERDSSFPPAVDQRFALFVFVLQVTCCLLCDAAPANRTSRDFKFSAPCPCRLLVISPKVNLL